MRRTPNIKSKKVLTEFRVQVVAGVKPLASDPVVLNIIRRAMRQEIHINDTKPNHYPPKRT
jgi:hypothetical protein